LKLVDIDPNSNKDIKILYKLLSKREHSISHKELPSYEKHELFVKKNPYRRWFLIKCDSQFIGSLYVLKDNGIGIDMNSKDYISIGKVINLLYKIIKPLKAKDSIRVERFHINISPNNFELEKQLKILGAIYKQKTYEFNF